VSFGGYIFSVPLQDVHACSRARSVLLTCLGNLYQLKLEFSRNLSEEAEHEKCRYTEEQIIGILKQHEAGVKTADLCREHGVSAATVYGWEQKVGGMEGERGAAASGDGGRELWSEVVSCGAESAWRGAEGNHKKKRLELAGLREEMAFVSAGFWSSERTACKLLCGRAVELVRLAGRSHAMAIGGCMRCLDEAARR
jgi:transposase-like protein